MVERRESSREGGGRGKVREDCRLGIS